MLSFGAQRLEKADETGERREQVLSGPIDLLKIVGRLGEEVFNFFERGSVHFE
jgi:hypothetical protein